MEAKLIIISPDVQPKEFKLSLPTTIGRSRQATIKLAHALVSRIHCELFEADGVLMVRDLGSLNGTFVGSQQVQEGPISSGDTLTVGTVTFQAQYDQAADPHAKTKSLGTTMAAKAAAAAGVGSSSDNGAKPSATETPPGEGEMENLDELWMLDDDDESTKRKKPSAAENQKTVNAKSAQAPAAPAAPPTAKEQPSANPPAGDDDDVLEWLKNEDEDE